MLTYTRLPSGDHVWRDKLGFLALWKGGASWYWAPVYDARVERLCPADWPDGDAITMYRAKVKAHQLRQLGLS